MNKFLSSCKDWLCELLDFFIRQSAACLVLVCVAGLLIFFMMINPSFLIGIAIFGLFICAILMGLP